MKIVVTGSRDWQEPRTVRTSLDEWMRYGTNGQLLERVAAGDAMGVDDAALTWARIMGISHAMYGAAWERYGKIAGNVRNERMLLTEKPDLVLAFPDGVGTADCVDRAKRMGINVLKMRHYK